jgi:hypothetical protein
VVGVNRLMKGDGQTEGRETAPHEALHGVTHEEVCRPFADARTSRSSWNVRTGKYFPVTNLLRCA